MMPTRKHFKYRIIIEQQDVENPLYVFTHPSFQEKQSVHTHRKKPQNPSRAGWKTCKGRKRKKTGRKTPIMVYGTQGDETQAMQEPKTGQGKGPACQAKTSKQQHALCGEAAASESRAEHQLPASSSVVSTPLRVQTTGGCWLTPLLPRPPPPLPHKRQQLPTIPFPSPPFFLRPPLFVPPNPPSPFEIAPKPPGPGGDSPPRRLPPRRHQSPRLARVDPSHSFDPASRGRLRFFPGRRRPDSGSAGRSALIRRREVLLVSPTSKPRFLIGLSGGSLGAAVRRRRRRVVGGMGLLRRGIPSTRRGAAA